MCWLSYLATLAISDAVISPLADERSISSVFSVRIVAFNTSKGWSRDISEAIAREIRAQAERTGEKLPPGLRDWIDWQIDLVRRAERVRAQP